MCSWNNKHIGVEPRVQSMSVHSILARSSLGVVRCSLGGVRVHLLGGVCVCWPTENSCPCFCTTKGGTYSFLNTR